MSSARGGLPKLGARNAGWNRVDACGPAGHLVAVVAATILILALLSVGAATIPASAATGIPASGTAGEGGYLTPTAGSTPHGGYSASTNKCKVCHAVHGASAGGAALLRTEKVYEEDRVGGSSCSWCHPMHGPGPVWPSDNGIFEDNVSTPCVYCHIVGSFAIKKVYGGDPDNYWMESTKFNYLNNHASSHGMGSTVYYRGCPSCHSVHGTNTWDPDTGDSNPATNILRNNPGPSLTPVVTNMDDFCRDCHDMTGLNGANDPSTEQLCGRHCHKSYLYPAGGGTIGFSDVTGIRAAGVITKSGAHDGVSHIMTTSLTNATGDVRALVGTPTCRSCHSGGDHTADNSWPHMTAGAQFLSDDYTQTTHLDKVCLSCHDDGVPDGTFGVGDSF
ncbi:MAG: hypothetical protein ACYC6T_12375 [Thermoleophilia bacterium]